MTIGLALAACAGRDPQPIATVQPQNQYSDCAQISAEIQANNVKVKQLADEQGGMKTVQNVAAGVVDNVIFGMDFKGAEDKELVALQARQQYLTTLAAQRCAQPGPPPYPPPPIATVQPQNQYSDCAQISAEIQANNVKVKQLADEQGGMKTVQNVAAGVVDNVIFGMDFKGAEDKELVALQARQQYLTTLAAQRCAQPGPPPYPPPPYPPPPGHPPPQG